MDVSVIVAAVLVFVGVLAFALAGWGALRTKSNSETPKPLAETLDAYENTERRAMPEEIANAALVISERTLKRGGPRPFAAKTDQVFRTELGFLVPVETKTRRRVTASDIVQISCQAVALQEIGTPADYGYIRLSPPGRNPIYQRVKLLGTAEIDRLWERYQQLRTRKAQPTARPTPSRCSRCAFRAGCKSAVLR